MDIPDAGGADNERKEVIVCVCVFRAGRISWDFGLLGILHSLRRPAPIPFP